METDFFFCAPYKCLGFYHKNTLCGVTQVTIVLLADVLFILENPKVMIYDLFIVHVFVTLPQKLNTGIFLSEPSEPSWTFSNMNDRRFKDNLHITL